MQDRRVHLVLIAVFVIALLGGGVALRAAHRPAPPPIVITSPGAAGAPAPDATSAIPLPVVTPTPAVPKPAPQPQDYVHVAGAVKKPSLYLLPDGSRVMQAIKAAGGPRGDADLDAVNLAEKIHDGEKIYIPVKSAAPQPTAMISPPGNSLGGQSVASPSASSTEAVPVPLTPANVGRITKSAKGGAGKAAKLSSPSQGQVNINTASADQLERLPGIGPAMAARILAYRQQAGGFQKIDELQEISGIGPKKYAKIAPLVKLQ